MDKERRDALEKVKQEAKKLSQQMIKYLLGKEMVFEIYDKEGNVIEKNYKMIDGE